MKKITLILSVFILILSTQSYAQEATPLTKSVDQIEYDDQHNDKPLVKREKRKRAHKQVKQRKRAQKSKLRAMRRVAKADGVVTPQEKRVIRKEKRKMKHKAVRTHKRNKMKKTQDPGRLQGRI